MLRIASYGANSRTEQRITISSAIAESVSLIMKNMPKIVEYHVGSRDMIQSVQASVIVRAYTRIPGAAHTFSVCHTRGEASPSCFSEPLRSAIAHRFQIAK